LTFCSSDAYAYNININLASVSGTGFPRNGKFIAIGVALNVVI